MDLNGKVAIVTGAARGIGLAYCEKLLEKNVKVCLSDILIQEGELAVKTLEGKYGKGKVIFVKCDVTNDKEFENLFIVCKNTFGDRIDILVNNAGTLNEVNWQRMIDVNFKAVLTGVKLALKYLGKEDDEMRGVVVNTSSISGLGPMYYMPAYVGTKHAIIGLTRSYGDSLRFKYNKVKVNAICPGRTDTDFQTDAIFDPIVPKESIVTNETQFPMMSAEEPAKALIKILEEGKNGACILVGSPTKVHYIDFPEYMS